MDQYDYQKPKNRYVTTMINPDGTVTVRRKVLNPDGSYTVKEEEHPSADHHTDETPTVHLTDSSDSISSITDMKTSILSTTSSKEDVFFGIEDTPGRKGKPKERTPERKARMNSSLSPYKKDDNMHTALPTPYHNPLPPAGAHNNGRFVESPRFQSRENTGKYLPPSPVYDWDFRQLKESGPLLDTISVAQVEGGAPISVSVFKKNLDDRIGISVGLKRMNYKDCLVVTKISKNGLLSESSIQNGDVILSINSHSFLDDPHTEDALAIVTQTLGRITFEVQKQGKAKGEAVVSPLRLRTTEKASRGAEKTVTSEVHNGDGSLTVVVDQVDEYGERIHREIRRERCNADNGKVLRPSSGFDATLHSTERQDMKQETFNPYDGSSLRQSTTSSDPSLQYSERRKAPKEKRIVVTKTEKSQKIGLKLEMHEGDTNILIVTGIHPVGLIATTQSSLVVGDVIVNINGFDFRESASLEIANTIIRNSTGEITIYAIDGEDFLDAFSKPRIGTESEPPFTPTITPSEDFRGEMGFDEHSYGGSIGTYISSKVVRISKSDPNENVGLKLVQQRSHWGLLLAVLEISGKAVQSGINVGDAILSINGVNFRSKPDPDRAAVVLNKATNVVVIEFQRLSEMNAALPAPRRKAVERADKRNIVSKNSMDSRASKRIEDFDATFQTKGASSRSAKSDSFTAKTDSIKSRQSFGSGQSHRRSPSKSNPNYVDVLKPQFVPPKSDTIIVRVKKDFPEQDVGLKVEAVNGVLYVSKISLQGLFVGKSIVPGDIILSINNKWFLENASVAKAEAVIRRAAKLLVIEVKKSPGSSSDANETKPKWHERIQCKKQSGESV